MTEERLEEIRKWAKDRNIASVIGSSVYKTVWELIVEIDVLRAERDALLEDQRRLEWIIAAGMWCLQSNNGGWTVFVPGDQGEPEWKQVGSGQTPREAIDAAMRSEAFGSANATGAAQDSAPEATKD